MEFIQAKLLIIGQILMIITMIFIILFLIKNNRRQHVKDKKLALDYIITLINIRNIYKYYGFDEDVKKLDKQIKDFLMKMNI